MFNQKYCVCVVEGEDDLVAYTHPSSIGPGKGQPPRMALPPFGDSWSWVRCSGSTSHPPSFFSGSSLPFSPPASSRRLQGDSANALADKVQIESAVGCEHKFHEQIIIYSFTVGKVQLSTP